MPHTVRVSITESVEAPSDVVYGVLADYRRGHPHILPERHFSDFTVEEGGTGAGTIIRYKLRTAGNERTIRAVVHEPEPGRILTETDLETGALTTFRLEPASGTAHTSLTITTEWQSAGLRGFVERWLAPPLLRKIYREEVRKLNEFVRVRK